MRSRLTSLTVAAWLLVVFGLLVAALNLLNLLFAWRGTATTFGILMLIVFALALWGRQRGMPRAAWIIALGANLLVVMAVVVLTVTFGGS